MLKDDKQWKSNKDDGSVLGTHEIISGSSSRAKSRLDSYPPTPAIDPSAKDA
jgi:hypothetical protein